MKRRWKKTGDTWDIQTAKGLAQKISELPEVSRKHRKVVKNMLTAMADRMMGFADAKRGIKELNASIATVATTGLDGHDDEGYYSSEEESEVEEATAKRRLGEATSVTLADSIWRKCVPPDLLKKYRRHLRTVPAITKGNDENLEHMLESVRTVTKGVKQTKKKATTSACLRPKTQEKCRLLLHPKEIHRADSRRPPRFRLTRLEDFGGWMAEQRRRRRRCYLAKIDLVNCYRSVHLPRRWRQIFVVRAGRHNYRITRLPFGWKYSPAICQRLVDRMVHATLRRRRWAGKRRGRGGRSVPGWTYLDDIMASHSNRSELRGAMRGLVHKFTKAGFLISPKSVLAPQRQLDFVGKHLEPQKCEISNKRGTAVAALRTWLGLLAKLNSTIKTISSALGKLAWALRPAGGAGTFMAGMYRALHGAVGTKVRVPTLALRGMGVGVMLAHMPHRFTHIQKTGSTFFSDAAERPERRGA